MNDDELVAAVRGLKVETGSLTCLGCGHEHNCGIHGCAILRNAADTIENLKRTVLAQASVIVRLSADNGRMLEAYDAMARDLQQRTAWVRALQERLNDD